MDFAIGQKGEMMGDLKPCPFCGRIPDIEDCGEHRWFIRCKCGTAQDKLFFQKCDAVKAWNKRKELRVKDTNVPITDTISRQAAIDAMSESLKRVFPEHRQIAEKCLNALPSAQPERKKGEWIEAALSNHTYKCSVCGRLLVNIMDGKNNVAKHYPYCHCGADMRGEQ